jgi:hypothetical protein
MVRKKYAEEQIIAVLKESEVSAQNGGIHVVTVPIRESVQASHRYRRIRL